MRHHSSVLVCAPCPKDLEVLRARVMFGKLVILGLCTVITVSSPTASDLRWIRDTQELIDEDFNLCQKFDIGGNSSVNLEGQITVLFKFDELRNRFEDAGFKSIHFVGVSPVNSRLLDIMKDIPVLHTSQHENLQNMSKNQVYVIDHCSRLVYIIVPPWSFIQYPYVKASILSTIYDAPCGSCNESSGEELLETTTENAAKQDDLEAERDGDEGFIIPIKVILPVEHIHHLGNQSTYTKYNYIVLRTDNATYHGHLNTDRGEKLTVDQNAINADGYYSTDNREVTTVQSLNFEEENEKEFEEEKLIYVNDKRDQYQKIKTYKIPIENGQITFDEVSPLLGEFEEFVTEVNSTQDIKQMDDHYEKLLQWLDYSL
uniref:Selenoprotein P N-terminal domain-containing protein n=2 Tax=Lutzomyia longipalpis TaxID=7200 RepID=A0A1B0GHI3_LUTLO